MTTVSYFANRAYSKSDQKRVQRAWQLLRSALPEGVVPSYHIFHGMQESVENKSVYVRTHGVRLDVMINGRRVVVVRQPEDIDEVVMFELACHRMMRKLETQKKLLKDPIYAEDHLDWERRMIAKAEKAAAAAAAPRAPVSEEEAEAALEALLDEDARKREKQMRRAAEQQQQQQVK